MYINTDIDGQGGDPRTERRAYKGSRAHSCSRLTDAMLGHGSKRSKRREAAKLRENMTYQHVVTVPEYRASKVDPAIEHMFQTIHS